MKLLNDGILHINPASMLMGHIPTATKHVEYRRKSSFRQEAHFPIATNHKSAWKLAPAMELVQVAQVW